MPFWENWAGSVSCKPERLHAPDSLESLRAALFGARANSWPVRVAGSGHSFTPICATDGLMIDLSLWQGVVWGDLEAGRASVRAGTVISDMGEPLRHRGLALMNQGDIDRQAIAGAIGTGTHGTGRRLGSLSSMVAGMTIMTANGDLWEVTREREPAHLEAAALSLGLFGVTVAVTLDVIPAYNLHERQWEMAVDGCLARIDEFGSRNRHFEFFWYPEDDLCHAKTLSPTTADPTPMTGTPGQYVDFSYKVFPSERTRRFVEMEYAVPRAVGPDVFRAIRTLMQTRYPDVRMPVEFRSLASDPLWLSPAHERDVVTLSIHQEVEKPHEDFFAEAEAVFRAAGGRPHWGKLHGLTREELAALYPRYNDFVALRRDLDPENRFLTPYLADLFA